MSLGFYIDMERCIGCRTCQVACKDRRDIQQAGPRLRRVDSFETGAYPEVGRFHLVLSCNHCAHPMCMANCSTGALYMNDDGIVLVDDEKCNGCQACVEACPLWRSAVHRRAEHRAEMRHVPCAARGRNESRMRRRLPDARYRFRRPRRASREIRR